MALVTLLSLGIAAYIFPQLYMLYENYQHARRTGLRIVVTPIDPHGFLWQATSPILKGLMRKLPPYLTLWFRVLDMGWSWEVDYATHEQLGDSFIICGAGRNVLYTANFEAITWVLGKRKEFTKPEVYSELLPG